MWAELFPLKFGFRVMCSTNRHCGFVTKAWIPPVRRRVFGHNFLAVIRAEIDLRFEIWKFEI